MFDEEPDGDPHGECAVEIRRLEIALRIKTEEHQCCSEDLMKLRKSEQEGWKEAAIAWEVCASIHETWAKGKDALFTTRHGDFERHAEDARQRHALLTPNALGQEPCAGVCARSPAPMGSAALVDKVTQNKCIKLLTIV